MKQHEHEQREILVVDDEADNLGVISGYLHDAGYRCSVASNGNTAIERAARITPGVILLDVKMSGMDGFEVCRRLKQLDSTRDIPVIFVTALDDRESQRLGFGAGGVDYITKPVRKEELLARVGTHVDNYRYKHALEQAVERRTAQLEQANTRLSAEIVERKRAETAARESERNYKSIVDNMHDVFYRINMQNELVFASPSALDLLGYDSMDDIIGADIAQTFYLNPHDRAAFLDLIRKEGRVNQYAAVLKRRDGTPVHVETNAHLIVGQDGNPVGLEGVVRDITERKRTEESLTAERNVLRTLIDNLPDYICIKDVESRFVHINPAIVRQLGATTPDEVVGKTDFDFHAPELAQQYYDAEQELIRSGRPLRNREELYFDQETGVMRVALSSKVPLRDTTGAITGLVAIVRDISERKQAEEHIEASLKEKEVLLQEIHHRVKNNLQIISSLLDMSRLRTRDQAAIELLTDARARIHSMALIHTQLYQSERFDQVDMDSHIRELIRYLSGVYADRKRIRPVVEVSGVCLALTQAIPCALALNELIANAFKHAFTEGQQGTLTIAMQQSAGGAIALRVNDNGIGIRDDIDLYHTNTMGLKLVRKLVQQQLKGDVKVIRNAGTELIITFNT